MAAVLSLAFAGAAPADHPDDGARARLRLDLYGDPLPPGAVARLGTLRDNIGDQSSDIVLSPDGKSVTATSGFFHIPLRLWDVSTGRVTLELKQLDRPIRAVGNMVRRAAFSPDGKLLAAGDAAGTVRIGRTDNGQKVLEIPGADPVSALRFLPGGKILAVSYYDFTIGLFAVATGERIRSFGPGEQLPGVLDRVRLRFLSPSGKLHRFLRDGYSVVVRNQTTGRDIRRFPYLRRRPV